MAKLWAGRFEKPTNALLDDFQSSIPFDQRMLSCDVTGSIAHATMLGEQGIISMEDSQAIVEGLKTILDEYNAGTLEIDMGAEDVHMFVEALLTERIGDAGKRLHTGRSRNDQVALDVRMLHSLRAQFFTGGPEGSHPGSTGKSRPGQHTARVRLDVHFAPGHFPEGLPLSFPSYRLSFQQIAKQECLHRQ